MASWFKRLTLTTGLLIGLSLFLVPIKTSAASPNQSLTISPDTANEVVQAGSLNPSSITLKNQGTNGYNYTIYATPYSVLGQNYTPKFTASPPAVNISSWFSIYKPSGYLSSGSSTVVNYVLSIPKATPAGGYYGAIFVQTRAPILSSVKTGFQLNQRVGELFYLRVAGPALQAGKLLSWQAGFLQKPPAGGTLQLENNGNVHYISNINVSFRDILGNPKYVYIGNYVVLPHTIRRIVVTWPKPPIIGLFKVNGLVTTYGIQKLSTKYILVVSRSVRITFIIIVSLLLLVTIIKSIIRHVMKLKESLKKDGSQTKAKRHDI